MISNVRADNPCGLFIVKITYYTQSGQKNTGIISYDRYSDGYMIFSPIEYFYTLYNREPNENDIYFISDYGEYTIQHRISPNLINFEKIAMFDTVQNAKIIAVNKKVTRDSLVLDELNGFVPISNLLITNKISEYQITAKSNYSNYSSREYYNGEFGPFYSLDSANFSSINFKYGQFSQINLDTISLIVLDSILWCGDFEQVHFLNNEQVNDLQNKNIYTVLRLDGDFSDYCWCDFISFDNKWSKQRIVSSIDLKKGYENIYKHGCSVLFDYFSMELKTAIKNNKIIYLIRWSP